MLINYLSIEKCHMAGDETSVPVARWGRSGGTGGEEENAFTHIPGRIVWGSGHVAWVSVPHYPLKPHAD